MSQKGEFSLSSVNALWHSPDAESPAGAAVNPPEPGSVCPGSGTTWILGHISVEIS